MDTKNRIWWGTAVLSVSALMLTACGDGGDDDAPAEETAAEETEETPGDEAGTTEDEAAGEDAAQDEEAEDDAESRAALSEDEIRELLLTEEEFPAEVEDFEAETDLAEGGAITMPDADAVESCEDLAEMMQDPQSAEEYAESGEEIDVAGLFNTGMWNLETAEVEDLGMLQTGLMSYGGDRPDFEEDYELIRECEGETFTMEDEGVQVEASFEYLEYQDWEGMTVLMSTSFGEESVDFDMTIFSYEDGPNVLVVAAMGQGEDHLEELADLQLEKYEAGA